MNSNDDGVNERDDDTGDDIADEKAFRALVELVSVNDFKRPVAAYFAKNCREELSASLGDPQSILAALKALAQDTGADASERERVATLYAEVEGLISQGAKPSAASDDDVLHEAAHARDELCRHWIDMLLLALEYVPQGTRIKLDTSLRPATGELGQHRPEWDQEHKDSLQSLYNNVALISDDVGPLLQSYRSSLKSEVEVKDMAAPNHCLFSMQAGALVFGRAGAVPSD